MKAVVQERYGAPDDVLDLQEVDMPEVESDEVLLRVRATAVAGDDWHIMRGWPYAARPMIGLFKPRKSLSGLDVAGRVEAVGSWVTEFRPGDEVFGWCEGAFAEYVSVSEDTLALKPANLTLEQAAVVPVSGFTALQALRDKGQVQPGDQVLIVGASGGVGTFAVQLAKAFGAEVTGVCSKSNVELVRSIGADHVIDYHEEDFTTSMQRFDLILDLVGNRSVRDCRRVLTPTGTLVIVGGSGGRWIGGVGLFVRALLVSPFISQRVRTLVHTENKEDLLVLRELIEAGHITPVISAQYSLDEIPEAIGHFEAGHARGKVVITV